MARARAILEFIYTVDEQSSMTVDMNPSVHVSRQGGYTYMDRGQKSLVPDSERADGTKPSGMMMGGEDRDEGEMAPDDMARMGTRS